MSEKVGILSVAATSLEEAIKAAQSKTPYLWPEAFPNFDINYEDAQSALKFGKLRRHLMPVLSSTDYSLLKGSLGDQIPVYSVAVNPHRLIPLQYEVYLDKVLDFIAANGVIDTKSALAENPIYMSADLHIIDGHHRWLSAMLLGVDIMAYDFGLKAEALYLMGMGLSMVESRALNA